MPVTGDKRINEETYRPQVYILDRWVSLELLQDARSFNHLDTWQIFEEEFGSDFVIALKKYLKSE